MRRCYLRGFRAALRRWPLALLLFAATFVPGLTFTAAAWSWLATALDRSLATRTLLADLDMNVFVDLLGHHGDSLSMLLAGGAVLAVVCWFFGVWLNAVTVAAVGEDVPLATAAHRGLDLYATFLGLGVLAVVLDGSLLLATVALGRWMIRWTAENPSETIVSLIVGGCGSVAALLLLFVTATHDHARIHSAATGTRAGAAYLWALRFVAAGEPRALPLLLLLLLTGGGGWLVYQTVGRMFVTTSTPAVLASMLWGEVFMLCRMFLRIWTLASQVELQNLSEVTPA